MNKYGWTSWGWYSPDANTNVRLEQESLRRWKWHGRTDLFVETNDDEVLLFLSSALEEMGND